MDKKNTIKVYTTSSGAELNISAPSTKQIISATNNRAQYFAEQAKKYRDEAKLHRDNAKYYAEQNSDVTFEYIDNIRTSLENKIATKQNRGDYALKNELPENVSELINDAEYVNQTELDSAIAEVELPSQEGCAGRFLMSDGENESWVGINSFQLFDTKLSDHVLTFEESLGWALQGTYVYKEAIAGSRYGYPDFYAKCLEEYNEATGSETVNDVVVKVHSNGHKFFDIADKEAIDEFYNTYGAAWFYGIDTENERVFLPRNNWFEQMIGDTAQVGDFVEAGLPNITGSFAAVTDHPEDAQNAFSLTGTTVFAGGTKSYTVDRHISFNASRSNSIYGKSDTVQPNAVKKLLYICVGNTTSESVITDVIDVTTTENDTVPLGYSTYQTGIQPNTSWLKSQGQWNDGKVYTTFYNWAVNKLNQAFASGYVKEVTETYDDYDLVINQDDMTFRLPLLNGTENMIDYTQTATTITTNWVQDASYVAPKNGMFRVFTTSSAAAQFINYFIDGKIIFNRLSTYSGENSLDIIKVDAGNILTLDTNYGGTKGEILFLPAIGNGSLYFKVANAVENLELLDAGEVLEMVSNLNHVTEIYTNGTSWYRTWSDGWCVQGGFSSNTDITISLLQAYKDTNYCITTGKRWDDNGAHSRFPNIMNVTTSSFYVSGAWSNTDGTDCTFYWRAEGYIR